MGDIGGFGQKSAAKKASRTRSRDIRRLIAYASPEQFKSRYREFRPFFEEELEPARRRVSDAAALGEQTALQAFEADVGRRGLSGSGLHLAGRGAIRGGRQAMTSEALTRFYEAALRGAREEAGAGQRALLAGIGGTPPAPQAASGGAAAADAAANLFAIWLATRKA